MAEKYELIATGDGRFELHGPDGAMGEFYDREELAQPRIKELTAGNAKRTAGVAQAPKEETAAKPPQAPPRP